jgi:hypothetical protein
MSTGAERNGVSSETAFAALMVVVSVVIFLAVRNSERPGRGAVRSGRE